MQPSGAAPRLAVFTNDLSYNVRRQIAELSERLPGSQWLILVHAPSRTLGQLVASQRMNARKHGWRWIRYQAGEVGRRVWGKLFKPALPGTPAVNPGGEYELAQMLQKYSLQIQRVADIHSQASLQTLRDFKADLGLSLAAPILKPALFETPRLGTINLHKGRLPNYRGMPPAFWELWNDEQGVGCSVHWVDAKLDQGALLAEAVVARERYSDPRGLQIRLDEVGVSLVNDVATKVLTEGGDAGRPQPREGGKTYRKPTLLQTAQLQQRLDAQLPRREAWFKHLVKEALCRLAWAAHLAWLWRVAQPRVTVLLFHRVTDEARDNLSVGVSQFERLMQLLKQHCEVLSIEQVLALGDAVPRSRRPLVAVTFDDGYLDNYTHAAPILRRLGLPAGFYVSTGIVASDRQFPHDQRRGNATLPVMAWDQIRQMHAWGFNIGSHTVSHVDCVAEEEGVVRTELQQSRADLQREIGRDDLIFAYPYGGRHQMNAQRLELVRQAGYAACLSAYGGSNVGRVDTWNVLRRGIHWEFSDRAFLYQCLGWS